MTDGPFDMDDWWRKLAEGTETYIRSQYPHYRGPLTFTAKVYVGDGWRDMSATGATATEVVAAMRQQVEAAAAGGAPVYIDQPSIEAR